MTTSLDHVVKVQQATIFQENVAVLSDISFEVEKGETFSIVGHYDIIC